MVLSTVIEARRAKVEAAGVPATEEALPMTPVWSAKKEATTSVPTRLPTSTRPPLVTNREATIRRRSRAIGNSIMFPVSRSAPATTTRMRPRLKVMPVTRVVIPPISPGRARPRRRGQAGCRTRCRRRRGSRRRWRWRAKPTPWPCPTRRPPPRSPGGEVSRHGEHRFSSRTLRRRKQHRVSQAGLDEPVQRVGRDGRCSLQRPGGRGRHTLCPGDTGLGPWSCRSPAAPGGPPAHRTRRHRGGG